MAEKGNYTIQTGDSLSKIALSELGDISLWTELAKANNLESHPNLIYAGKTLDTTASGVANKYYDLPRDIYDDDYVKLMNDRIGKVMDLLNRILTNQNKKLEQLKKVKLKLETSKGTESAPKPTGGGNTPKPVSGSNSASGGSTTTLQANTPAVTGTKSGTPSTSKTTYSLENITDGIKILADTYGIDNEAARKLLRNVLIDKNNPKLYRGNFVGNSEIKVGDFIEYGHKVNTRKDVQKYGNLIFDLGDYIMGFNKSAIVVDVNGTGRNREFTVVYFNPKTLKMEIGYLPATQGHIKRAYRNKPEKIKEWAK